MSNLYRLRDKLRVGTKKRSYGGKKTWQLIFSDDFQRANGLPGNNWVQNILYLELLGNSSLTNLGILNFYYNQTVTGGNGDWGHLKAAFQRNKEKYSINENYKVYLHDVVLTTRSGDPYGAANFAIAFGSPLNYDIYGSPHYVWTPTQTPTVPTFMINKTPSTAGQAAFGYNKIVQSASSFGFGTLNGSTYFSMCLEFLNKERRYRLKVWQTGYPEPKNYLIDTTINPADILTGDFFAINTAIIADWPYPICKIDIKKIEIFKEINV